MPHPLTHGIDTYFREFFGNRRRVAVVLLIVSAATRRRFPKNSRK